jgi:hypothetical protein
MDGRSAADVFSKDQPGSDGHSTLNHVPKVQHPRSFAADVAQTGHTEFNEGRAVGVQGSVSPGEIQHVFFRH